MSQQNGPNGPEQAPTQVVSGNKMEKFKDAMNKSIPYCVDVLFGAIVVYFIYVYCLFRFKVKFYVGDEPIDPESPLGRFVSSLFMLLGGYIAQNVSSIPCLI